MDVRKRKLLLLAILGIFLSMSVSAQNSVKGNVKDASGIPIIGASVYVKGHTGIGVVTDLDGDYEFHNLPSTNAILVFSFIGFTTIEEPLNGRSVINVIMREDDQMLEELVVIGYGTAKKSDLTGSITTIGEKEFNRGQVTSPAELITGKVAGVQVTSTGGRAGSSSRIRIRGGASLSATNDPLIVLDGVPLSTGGVSGASSALATINPNDIESMNVLKDASATAIYGSRASNGVIIITTKKGASGQKLSVDVSSINSLATIARKVDVMDANEFRQVVNNNPFTSDTYIGFLGDANTNWQDEIYRNAFTTDNNITVTGSIGETLPFRVSGGFMSQDGILKTDNVKRGTGSISLSPSFFDNHLKVNANLKGTYTDSFFGNGDAIGAALRMDPTQPVKVAKGFEHLNGYYAWLSGGSDLPNTLATYNPVALLNSKDDNGKVYRSIGNLQLDYRVHFLPDLRANVNLGYDISQGKGDVVFQKWAPNTYAQGGQRSKYKQENRNLLFEAYLNYTKEFTNNKIEVMAGHTYQDWKTTDYSYDVTNYDRDVIITPATRPKYTNQNTLISYYGRLNYTLLDRYMLTATVRHDGSSRFNKDNRWGTFPSVALAWRISEEGFLQNVDALSNLKLRLGYGVTGQQDGIGNYEYLAKYSQSDLTAQYQFGDTFYQSWRPDAYDQNRKWEETRTYNIGLDYGFMNNRVWGSVDFYHKDTKNLLNTIDIPLGSNFSNRIVKNIGSMLNNGFEASINVVAIDRPDLTWDIGFNISHNYTKITKLTLNEDINAGFVGVAVGGVSGGTGHNAQMHAVNHAPYTFYLYKQLYYPDGTPIEGGFADLNGDGKINEEDRYFVHSPEPDVFMGFNTSVNYKQWSLSTALRGSIGNYMYNNVYSDLGNYSQLFNPNSFLMNSVRNVKESQFYNRNVLSDYYLENASFLKMDYLTLGYNLGRVANFVDIALNLSVQNVFTITKYEGIDPENPGGIDGNFYPNPRTFSLGINLHF